MAEKFQVAPRTIDNWMRDGVLPYLKIGKTVRFDIAAVETEQAKFVINSGRKRVKT